MKQSLIMRSICQKLEDSVIGHLLTSLVISCGGWPFFKGRLMSLLIRGEKLRVVALEGGRNSSINIKKTLCEFT
jgi:hypothetical protein